MRRVLTALAVVALLASGCKEKPQPAEEKTAGGNATDRNPATGTTGTGEPLSQATQTAAAAQNLGTVAPSAASTGTQPVMSGTADVHAANTVTTSTIQGPQGTTTASVATPTQTTATVKH
jgi:hypothetical protein